MVNFALNSHPHRETKWLKLLASSVTAHVCLQVKNNALKTSYNPKLETK